MWLPFLLARFGSWWRRQMACLHACCKNRAVSDADIERVGDVEELLGSGSGDGSVITYAVELHADLPLIASSGSEAVRSSIMSPGMQKNKKSFTPFFDKGPELDAKQGGGCHVAEKRVTRYTPAAHFSFCVGPTSGATRGVPVQ
jgi:hypothetical protein